MGGKALKRSCRLPRDEYLVVERYVIEVARQFCQNVFVPRYSDKKESFGDLDLIVVPKDPNTFRKDVIAHFEPQELVKSGDVLSIDFNLEKYLGLQKDDGPFQVDFILTKESQFHVNCFYFSFNDFGAILGGIFKNWGFSFGGSGLFHDVLWNDDRHIKLKTLPVTSNPQEILEILGLDPTFLSRFFDRTHGGTSPTTWTEIFESIITSPLFRPDYWCARSIHWNHRERTRAKLRPMYQEFLFEFLPKKYGIDLPKVVFSDDEDRPTEEEKHHYIDREERQRFVDRVLGQFGLLEQRDAILVGHRKQLTAKAKFSGHLVRELTGLEDRELGQFMAKLKREHPQTLGSIDWLASDNTTGSEIVELVERMYKSSVSKTSEVSIRTLLEENPKENYFQKCSNKHVCKTS